MLCCENTIITLLSVHTQPYSVWYTKLHVSTFSGSKLGFRTYYGRNERVLIIQNTIKFIKIIKKNF